MPINQWVKTEYGRRNPALDAAVLASCPKRHLPEDQGKFIYRTGPWKLGWTGFKAGGPYLVGQWFAYHDDGRRYYVSCPGGQGWYLKGEKFDIRIRSGQPYLVPAELDDVPAAIEKARGIVLDGLRRLCVAVEIEVPDELLQFEEGE